MKNTKIFEGILNLSRTHPPTLWKIPFDTNNDYYRLDRKLINKFSLISGARVKCEISNNRIEKIISICDLEPSQFKGRKKFEKLQASNPTERFDFSASKYHDLRILDMFAPIGMGTRGLIVSPPKAGKTTLLENLAKELVEKNPNLRVIVLLIDERPEEVTAFKMSTKADIYHSSMDKSTNSHILLSSLLINHLRVEIECGNDLVILLDSLTRMGRAYNLSERNSNGRTMSGGLGSSALELPRKLFGMARNIEDGGSCTILATILKDTGSRMDEVIFQEFKGTGNCDIILDREIAQERIFPAINILQSSTRKDHLLIPMEKLDEINSMRRDLLKLGKGNAILKIKSYLKEYDTNDKLLGMK